MTLLRPKLLFLDLDGTLLNSRYEVSSADREELKRVQKHGILTAFATGRPYFSVAELESELQISAPGLFFSGSLVYDRSSALPLLEIPIPKTDLIKFLAEARAREIYTELYTSSNYFVDADHQYGLVHANYLGKPPTPIDLDSLLDQKILKITLMGTSTARKTFDELSQKFPKLNFGYGYGAAHPEILFANITSIDATREKAFNLILKQLSIDPGEVISIGDGEQDITFIKLSGIGVAMGNAPDQVKNAANLVTETVENSGVAKVLREIIPE